MGRGLPPNWGSIRKQALERDDNTCGNCGRKGGPYGKLELEIHHIVERRNGGTHNLSNLKTLCRGCHAAITYDQTAPTSHRQSSVGFETRGEFRRYQEFIETLHETIDQFNQFVNSDVKELGELIQRAAAFTDEDRPLPPEFADSYTYTHRQAEEGAREFQQQLNNFRDTSIEPFSDETTERYNRLLNQWLSTVFEGQELTESADELIEMDGNQATILTDTEAESDFVEAQQEYMESAQAASKTINRLDKSLANDLEKIQDEIDAQDTQDSVIQSILSALGLEGILNDFRGRGGENVVFDGCPVCGMILLAKIGVYHHR